MHMIWRIVAMHAEYWTMPCINRALCVPMSYHDMFHQIQNSKVMHPHTDAKLSLKSIHACEKWNDMHITKLQSYDKHRAIIIASKHMLTHASWLSVCMCGAYSAGIQHNAKQAKNTDSD